ncbi:tetratricopeptide repeat protein, partial [Candidatus Bipolaricaulota bacterium]|nr:tetratricopeptide repeat protein [Candidatus Bipolaricaulota bacterium]
FEKALSMAPEYARALTGLADTYSLMVGRVPASEGFEEARSYTDRALLLDPECAEAHATLGYILWRSQGDVHGAEREFLHAIELNPNCAQAQEWYANLLVHTGRIEEACQQSENALSLDPLSAPLILTYAGSLHAARRLDEAVDQYQRALELNPELEAAWWGHWYSLAAAWDLDRAEAVTREVVAKYPDNACAYVNLSTCVMNRGRLEEGLAAIHKALELEPEPRRAYVLMHAGARFYFARDFEAAIDFLGQALERDPSMNFAHLLTAKCHMYKPRPCFEIALEEIAASERIYGGADPFWQVHAHMDRGKIYARRGETDKAEQELAILMRSSGRGGNRRIAVAGILAELGRMEEAMDWLEAAATAREAHIASLRMTPDADIMRPHPRFQALLRRVGLAD